MPLWGQSDSPLLSLQMPLCYSSVSLFLLLVTDLLLCCMSNFVREKKKVLVNSGLSWYWMSEKQVQNQCFLSSGKEYRLVKRCITERHSQWPTLLSLPATNQSCFFKLWFFVLRGVMFCVRLYVPWKLYQ